MDKQVHDPTGNVDRPPEREQREDSRELERDVKRDRRVERLVDATIEASFPASDPPSWTVGSSVIVEEEQERASAQDDEERTRPAGAPAPERASRATERGRARRASAARGHEPPRADEEDTLDMSREDAASATQPARKQQGNSARKRRAPGRAGKAEKEQTRTHLAPEHTDERTDLPGRRNTAEGPHQAFPGEHRVSPPKPISH